MNFCPKCGSIMMPRKKDGSIVLVCTNCGYEMPFSGKTGFSEKTKSAKKIEVVEKEVNFLPKTKAKCPKCGHTEAYYWLVQTRAGDEPETKFLKCVKCGHVWREYD